jgi:hypothetical protein
MTGRIVLAVAPGTAERAVDTAFALAAERGSALLVVGRSARPGHRASPVDPLVRQAACPVLVVPPARRSPITRSDTSASTSDGSFASRRRPVPTTTLAAWQKEDR